MANIVLQGLRLKFLEPKRVKKVSSISSRKIVYGTVINDNGILKVEIEDKNLTIPFTPESYELENRRIVFKKELENNRRVCIVRDASHAKYMPGLPEQYIPFAEHWLVKGTIVKQGLVPLFNFKELVSIDGYEMPNMQY